MDVTHWDEVMGWGWGGRGGNQREKRSFGVKKDGNVELPEGLR